MKAGKEDEDFYNAIEEYLGIQRQDLNSVLRKELNEKYN